MKKRAVKNQSGKEIEILSLARGIACVFIILFHYTSRYTQIFDSKLSICCEINFGYAFTMVFLLLSGYLMYRPETMRIKAFLFKKLLRIYPCYLVAVVLIFCTTSWLLKERSVLPLAFLANTLLINTPLGLPYVDGAHWYIYAEFVYILMFAIISAFAKKRQGLIWMAVSFMCLVLICVNKHMDLRIANGAYVLLQARYVPVFITGNTLAQRKSGGLWTGTGTLLICIATQCLTCDIAQGIVGIAFAAVLVLVTMKPKVQELNLRHLKILAPIFGIATISYPLYLLHQNIGYAVMRLIEKATRSGVEYDYLSILAALCVAALLAILFHITLEAPLKKISKDIIKGFTSRKCRECGKESI